MYPRLFLRSGHHTNGLINTKISFNKTYVDISLRCALSVKSWVVVYLFSNLGLVSWRWFRGHLGDKG